MNRKTEALNEKLETRGIDPVQGIIDELDQLLPQERVNVYLSLMAYLYPKRKATELTVTDEARLQEMERLTTLSDDELTKEIEDELEARKVKRLPDQRL